MITLVMFQEIGYRVDFFVLIAIISKLVCKLFSLLIKFFLEISICFFRVHMFCFRLFELLNELSVFLCNLGCTSCHKEFVHSSQMSFPNLLCNLSTTCSAANVQAVAAPTPPAIPPRNVPTPGKIHDPIYAPRASPPKPPK